ncbi:hypothetical protein [Streptomyces sp. NPDC051014]|uniref:hypothetical protein n=1 Tax=Streptomyces sp. NPDC051014 TaxID=3155751 RepID=UPI0033D2EBF9
MARLQILELPMEHTDTPTLGEPASRTPFAIVIDQLDQQAAEALRARPEILSAFGTSCGARAVGVFEYTVDVG